MRLTSEDKRYSAKKERSAVETNKKVILLVDDDRLVLLAIANELTKQGYRVISAETAEDAELLLIGGENPDLALLDVNLPGQSGLDLAKRLKVLDQIPFVFLSAYNDKDLIETATRLGAISYLLKPMDPWQLAPVIAAALARAAELKLLKASEVSLLNALTKEREINLAIGITMMQHKLDRKGAFERLRKVARDKRIKLAALSSEIISSAEALNLPMSKKS